MKQQSNITEIYNQYAQQLYFTALRITGNSYDAEEVMQDTIIKYHHLPQKEEIEKLGSWLKSVCIRKAIDRLREKHRTKEFMEEYREDQFQAAPQQQLQYSVEDIKKALLLLPDNYRTILSLHLFEGYDYQEIEQITGTKEATLRSLYKRGKEKLAALLQNTRQ
jgi:RNA polymerase sigma-70 factor (ECF subfamily)